MPHFIRRLYERFLAWFFTRFPPRYHAHVQWRCEHCGMLRVYETGKSFEAKDPYAWWSTVWRVSPGVVEIAGATEPPTHAMRWAIVAELLRQEPPVDKLLEFRKRRGRGGDVMHLVTHDIRRCAGRGR
jgi:hypothetical protein